MENIGNFLEGCVAYGVPKTDVFQTVDLYENQNMPQVGNARMVCSSVKVAEREGEGQSLSICNWDPR